LKLEAADFNSWVDLYHLMQFRERQVANFNAGGRVAERSEQPLAAIPDSAFYGASVYVLRLKLVVRDAVLNLRVPAPPCCEQDRLDCLVQRGREPAQYECLVIQCCLSLCFRYNLGTLMPKALPIDWEPIEKFMVVGSGDFAAAALQFGVKEGTIRKRASRYSWPLPKVIRDAIESRRTSVAKREANAAIIEKVVENWEERGETHRKTVFDLAHESLRKMKPRAPKNFREAEAADRMARRASGLENVDTIHQTLIQVNEAINDSDAVREARPVIEAEVIPSQGPAGAPGPTCGHTYLQENCETCQAYSGRNDAAQPVLEAEIVSDAPVAAG
jgi:hypothetical protein